MYFFFVCVCVCMYVCILERGREGEREKHQCVTASCVSLTGGLACNPGMCPELGIKPVTLWFSGWHSLHWDIPAKAHDVFIYNRKFVPFDFLYLFCSSPTPYLWQPPMCSLYLCAWFGFFVLFLDSTYKWDHMVFVFIWLISLSIMPSRLVHVVANGKILFFFTAE